MKILSYIIAIVFLVIEGFMIGYLIKRIIKAKKLSLEETIIYPILYLISVFVMYFSAVLYGGKSGLSAIPFAMNNALDVVRLRFNLDVFDLLLSKDKLLFFVYVLEYVVSAISLLTISILLIKVIIKNMFRFKIGQSEIDYLIAFNDETKKYIKSLSKAERKKTVVLFQEGYGKKYAEDKMFLDSNGIKFEFCPLKHKEKFFKTIKRKTTFKTKKYYFVSFYDNDKDVFNFINWTLEYLKSYDNYSGKVEFIINTCDNNQSYFIRELLKDYASATDEKGEVNIKNILDASKGLIRCFNKYELMAFDFVQEHNFAKYMPREYINDNCTIKDNITLNLYMIGFGKVNQALLKDILIQTHFVKESRVDKNGKTLKSLHPVRMNVNIYDEKNNFNNIYLSSGLLKYHKSNFNQDEYLELPEDFNENITFNFGKLIGEVDFINKIAERIDDNQMNYFIVSIGSDFENGVIANKLKEIKNKSDVIFVRTSNDLQLKTNKTNNIIPFGNNEKILRYSTVIADSIYKDAINNHFEYLGEENNKKLSDEDKLKKWMEISKIKQKSNLYAVASLKFKLSLLGDISFDAQKEKYGEIKENYPKLEKNNFTTRDVIGFLEHERWNAYHLGEGVLPLKKDLAWTDATGNANKTKDELYHFCITTRKGLLEYDKLYEKRFGTKSNIIEYDYGITDRYFMVK